MTELSQRLKKVAGMIKPGAFPADIGTDHGYLPVFLIQNGIISRAVASDIGEGPLKNAEKHINDAGYRDNIITMTADGLAGMEKLGITDAVIAGMGGYNIIGILENAPFVKEQRIHLVLQPMKNEPEVREYLGKNGFSILKEDIAVEGKFVYTVISAVYTGKTETYTQAELLLGRYCIENKDSLGGFDALCKKVLGTLVKKSEGLAASGTGASGADAAYVNGIINEIKEVCE